jgi:ferritin-like metal-binding protein YciE
MANAFEEHLVNYLSDAYAIEQQALAQLRTAPKIAGEPTLARHFLEHLEETELQAELVRERLEAHGGSPGRIKDAVMALGGKAFVLFARVQPDTPGKLAAHACSYEALEWAAYEMLLRMAQRAGDLETAAMARRIRDQEEAMLERLTGDLGPAAEASLGDAGAEDLERKLRRYLADAHALEVQSIELLERAPGMAGGPELERLYAEHRLESEEQARRLEARLEELDGGTSALKDAALRIGALEWSLFFRMQSDTPGKLAAFVYAVEHLEIAGYQLLRTVAERASDAPTAELAEAILGQERAMARRVAGAFDRAFEASLEALGVGVA